MSIELSPRLKERYPYLRPVFTGIKVKSECSLDNQRCLDPSEPEEDYSFDDEVITRVFTAFAGSCADCSRNTSQRSNNKD